MRAGKLDRTITIQKYALSGDDGWGNPTPTFTDLGSYRAEVVQGATEEFFRAGGLAEVQAIVFRTRYVAPDLSTADRVLHGGKVFNILEIREIGRRKGQEFRCSSTGETA